MYIMDVLQPATLEVMGMVEVVETVEVLATVLVKTIVDELMGLQLQ